MHFFYKTDSSWVGSNVVADIVKLVCGETTIANLSADCDQAQTMIVSNTVPADWTVHDAAGGANSLQIIKHLPATGSVYKYVGIDFVSGLRLNCYKSWNAGTHTATDSAVATAASGATLTQPLSIYGWVTGRYIVLMAFNNGTWNPLTIAGEIDRASAEAGSNWWAESNGQSVVCVFQIHASNAAAGTSNGSIPRLKSPSAAGDSVAPAVAPHFMYGSNSGSPTMQGYWPRNIDDSTGVVVAPMYLFLLNSCFIGKLHSLNAIVGGTNVVAAAQLDEFPYLSKTYQIAWPLITRAAVALPKE